GPLDGRAGREVAAAEDGHLAAHAADDERRARGRRGALVLRREPPHLADARGVGGLEAGRRRFDGEALARVAEGAEVRGLEALAQRRVAVELDREGRLCAAVAQVDAADDRDRGGIAALLGELGAGARLER